MVDIIGHSVDMPSVSLCSPDCLCVCNDENNFQACTKKAHHGWMEGEGGW